MNPNATLRFRRATAYLALAWSLLALLLAAAFWAGPLSLGPPFVFEGIATDPWRIGGVSAEAEAAGVREGDRVVRIDGLPVAQAFVDAESRFTPDGLNAYRLVKPDGTRADVALRSAETRDLITPLRRFAALVLALIGVVYLGTGLTVWRLRPDRSRSWSLLLFCCAMAAGLFPPGAHWGTGWYQQWLTLPLIGATTFHLFTTYPIEPAWVVRRPVLRAVPYGLALLLGAAAAGEAWLGPRVALAKPLSLYFTLILASGCLAIGIRERQRLRESRSADLADIMLIGAVVSFVPGILALLAENWLRSPFPWYLGFFSFFIFPLAVGYGIVRRQLFEIRGVAKSSATYGAVTLSITGLYALLVVFADAAVSRFNVDARSPWFSVGFLFFAILAFDPLRDRMQSLVDRLFDRDHALYRRAVREISDAMVSMLSTVEVVDRILIALTETMGVERALVLLPDPRGARLVSSASRGDWDEEALAIEVGPDHPIRARLSQARDGISRGYFDEESDVEVREACREVFDQLEVELLVPIQFRDRLLGVIAVGQKLSGDRLTADDRQLLGTLANQSSVAIENARAFDQIANLNATLEARVEARTRELRETQAQLMQSEKMRSLGQLVAGVAHELNNPIGFVHANLHLLNEYMRRMVDAQRRGEDTTRIEGAIEKLLARSREGTERVKQIVADLRTFSRMDRAELADVDLNEEIDRTLGLMEARFRDKIRVERDYGELPTVRCYAGQLNQVFMNLVGNACDAMSQGGTLRIKTRAVPAGVRVEIHDDGEGIPPELQARIFEPFFTSKPVGQGTGLGLSISYGIVERHGGRMLLGSAPGAGTTFVVELPLVANPPEGLPESTL